MPNHAFKKCTRIAAAITALLLARAQLGAQEQTQTTRLAPLAFTSPTSDWTQVLQTSLIKGPSIRLWMLVMPSFTPASALELDCTCSNSDEPKPLSFTIRWTEALDQTWLWSTPPPPPAHGAKPRRMPSRFKSRTRSVPLPPEAAQEVINAWGHMLRETRYPADDEFISGMDGTAFEFYLWRDRGNGRGQSLMGWTWSPQSGPTAMLVQLGEDLIAFVKSVPTQRPALLAKCVEEAKAIQAYQYR